MKRSLVCGYGDVGLRFRSSWFGARVFIAEGDLICALLMMVLRHCKWYENTWGSAPKSGTDYWMPSLLAMKLVRTTGQQLGRLIVMVHGESPHGGVVRFTG